MATMTAPPVPFNTKNDIDEEARIGLVDLLNGRLADAFDLASQVKVAHWNVKGPAFIALHKLFDDVYADVLEYVDLIAERAVQLGGLAEGTARVAAARSGLDEYPLRPISESEHVETIAGAISTVAAGMRAAIDRADVQPPERAAARRR
jgi:starvation-inducible DNA-binding protein